MKKLFSLLLVNFLALNYLFFAAPVKLTAQTKNQKADSYKIEGFVTQVNSPNSFEIGDYKITRDETTVLKLESQEGAVVQFKPENIRVGNELEVEGVYNAETKEIKAKKLTIDLDQFRKLTNTTVLNNYPFKIEKSEEGYRGSMWADGRRITIQPTTKIFFKLNKSEQKAAQAKAKNDKNEKSGDETEELFADAEPLTDVGDVKAGMLATYEAIEQPDGSVLASRVVFTKNELESGERKLWENMLALEKPEDTIKGKPAELRIKGVGKFKLLPNNDVQEYVKRVGLSLIPIYQKELPDDDPQKIPFRFYVVMDKQLNAFSLANGIIVINSGLIELLENEAQLAAVLSHEIAHSTQEHVWRTMNKDRGKKAGLMAGALAADLLFGGGFIFQMAAAAMVNKFSRRLENQADRIGLQYLVEAGYDAREAHRVWELMGKKTIDKGIPVFDFFYASHSAPATRRSHITIELNNNYSDFAFDKTRRGEEEYTQIVKLTQETVERAKNKKKKAKDDEETNKN